MFQPITASSCRSIPLVMAAALIFSSCDKPGLVEESPPVEPIVSVPAVISEDLGRNNINGQPGVLMQSQAKSVINWQPWCPETLEHAKISQRLIMCVIAMPHQSGIYKSLSELASNQETVDLINNHYVPVLIDGSALREMAVLAGELCAETKNRISFPLFLWMTCKAEPVAWHPVIPTVDGGINSVFKQSHVMIYPSWKKDLVGYDPDNPKGYMHQNSAHDNIKRRIRYEGARANLEVSENERADVVLALRKLTDLYDGFSKSFDKSGGLFPSGSIELLSIASSRPGIPTRLRDRSKAVVQELTDVLVRSAMFDPLEGGVYTAKAARLWDFPSYVRRCTEQAKAITTLSAAYRATGDPDFLAKSREVVGFVESRLRLPNGLFVMELGEVSDPLQWMWTLSEMGELLTEEELAWWREASQLKNLGNFPLELDPKRKLFRRNTLAMKKSVPELAAHFNMPIDEFSKRFEISKQKLIADRDKRVKYTEELSPANAEASLEMVSAYASLYSATKDSVYRDRAVTLMRASINEFYQGGELRIYATDASPYVNKGRAFHYALAAQAACDLAAITGELEWLDWAEKLTMRIDELFAGDLFLLECPEEAEMIDLPIEDRVMLFGDSTLGDMSLVSQSMDGMGRKLPERVDKLVRLLPSKAIGSPISYTDWLLASLNRNYPTQILIGDACAADLLSVVQSLPVREVFRRRAFPDESVPDGHIKLIQPDGSGTLLNQGSGLQEALLRLLAE